MSVRAEDLTKRFEEGGTPALHRVHFTAPAGAITTLLGPSGSGKTTALRIIAGLERPEQGRVFLHDVDVSNVPVQKRGVGVVFQGYALFPHMNVRKNIGFGLRMQGLANKAIDQRVDELLDLVQLTEFAHRFPEQLSGGQQQRVAFARALAPKPNVLLLDEPFAALDTQVRRELRSWLKALHDKTHITTILITHDQREALELSEHIVVMHEGVVVQAGSPREIREQPASPFVAAFIQD